MSTKEEKELYPLIIEADGDKYVSHLEGFTDATFSSPLAAFDEALVDINNYTAIGDNNKLLEVSGIDKKIDAAAAVIADLQMAVVGWALEKTKMLTQYGEHPLSDMPDNRFRMVYRAMCNVLKPERSGIEERMNTDIKSVGFRPTNSGMGFTWCFSVRELVDNVPINKITVGAKEED